MDFESPNSPSLLITFAVSLVFSVLALFSLPFSPRNSKSSASGANIDSLKKKCCFARVCADLMRMAPEVNYGGESTEMCEKGEAAVVEKQTGVSMMEQLVPEITTHAFSYLDFPSLCRLSMTNSLMRKAANDDNAWKALYHKDFTLEQDSVKPANGWKAYYAATRAIVNINAQFFGIIRDRSLPAMGHFWLNADYVKCIHATGEHFSGYNAVMGSWQIVFNAEQQGDGALQIRDVRTRVLTDMAWVSMKAFVNMHPGTYNITNVFEHHNGRWYMVHHHCSLLLAALADVQQIVHA